MAVRAIRGATQLDVDERDHLLDRTTELVRAVLSENALSSDDLISIVFTATPDICSEFPAYAARTLGMVDVPLLCTVELDITGAMQRVVRVLMHVDTTLTRAEITHVYLHGARHLRRDLTHVRTDEEPG
ncbi:chorismate mutase [soil metagenome]